MIYAMPAQLIVVILFAGIILFYVLGLQAMEYRRKRDSSYSADGMGQLEGAVLGLLSLLLAFTFN